MSLTIKTNEKTSFLIPGGGVGHGEIPVKQHKTFN